MKGFYLIITGDVTGVGFRKFIKFHAKKLGICGWVKNTDSHTVEAEIFGDDESLQSLISLCQTGPEISNVDSLIKKEITQQVTSSTFEIIR